MPTDPCDPTRSSTDDLLAETDLSEAADLLIAHARRDDAIALVADAVHASHGRTGLLLLARLNLGSGTRSGAEGAGAALVQWRRRKPYDLDAIVLLRVVLRRLDRPTAVSALDRDLRWTFRRGAAPGGGPD